MVRTQWSLGAHGTRSGSTLISLRGRRSEQRERIHFPGKSVPPTKKSSPGHNVPEKRYLTFVGRILRDLKEDDGMVVRPHLNDDDDCKKRPKRA